MSDFYSMSAVSNRANSKSLMLYYLIPFNLTLAREVAKKFSDSGIYIYIYIYIYI